MNHNRRIALVLLSLSVAAIMIWSQYWSGMVKSAIKRATRRLLAGDEWFKSPGTCHTQI